MKTMTPKKWEEAGQQAPLQTPPCRGGSKAG
jgi:hypothetical protein